MKLKICGIRVGALVDFYRRRLRRYAVQELFAGAGIAAGVALVLGVQVANTSISDSAERLVHGVTGSATLQLAARGSAAFDERVAERAGRLPDVRHAAPLLRSRVALVGPGGTAWVELLGGTPALAELGGDLLRNFGDAGLQLTAGVALPEAVARSIGAQAGGDIRVLSGAGSTEVKVGGVLNAAAVGPVAHTQAALAPLEIVQALTDQRGRLSQLIIEPEPGREEPLRRDLERVAGNDIAVKDADAELQLLRQAAKPNDQSTALFAAIGAMVGFLFAVNAMLITGPERRSLIADLRVQGYARKQLALILCFEALVLGVIASGLGLVLGWVLSRAVFDDPPEYLTFAFPVGSQRIVQPSTVALALGGGVVSALAASARPLLDLRRGRPLDAVFRESGEPGESVSPTATRRLLVAGMALVGAVTVIVFLAPDATIVGALALAVATVLIMPAWFSSATRYAERLTRQSRRLNLVGFALRELHGTRTRAITLAAVGAVAVYGSVTIGGAHNDLLRGLDRHFTEHVENADLWVTRVGDTLTTNSFQLRSWDDALARVPGVADVRQYRGGLFDIRGRRMYVIGRPRDDRTVIPPSQIVEGDLTRATELLREGRWATVPEEFADAHGLAIGDRLRIPGSNGVVPFRLAALTTNLGWPPGAIILNADDYAATWGRRDPTALEIDLAPGVAPEVGTRRIDQALGPASGLQVRTQAERIDDYRQMERQGLARLTQISTLLLIAAALAMASAMGVAIWERRDRLAALKVQGFTRRQLWRVLVYETGFVVAAGCLLGIALGVYGHYLADRYLELTTGFPAPFSFGGEQMVLALALVAGTAYVVISLPGRAAVRTPMSATLRGR